MRALVLMLLLACPQAWATKYVRPVADCPTSGDGSGYACGSAWSKMTGVVQSTPAAGEIVKTCGNFGPADADTGTAMLVGNWANAGVITDGDCSAEGGSARSTWDGGGVLARGFDSGSGGVVGAVVRNIDFDGFTAYGVLGQHADSDDWLIEHVTCDGALMTSQCIRNLTAGATGWVIRDSEFYNCYNDCTFSIEPMVFERLKVREWSTGNEIGDFYQHGSGSCDGFVFRDLDLQSSKDIKQAIIINLCTGPLNATVTDSRIVKLGQSTNTDAGFVGLFFDGEIGTVEVKRNYVTGGRINLFATSGVSLLAEGNVFGPASTSNVHCGTSTVACTVRHNTIAGAGTKGIEMQSAGAGGVAGNNAITAAIGINRGASGSESYNAIIASDAPCYVSGSPGACDASDKTDLSTMGWRNNNPTSADGVCLGSSSPLLGAGTYLGATVTGRNHENLGNPPVIGARGTCAQRRVAAQRRAVRVRL